MGAAIYVRQSLDRDRNQLAVDRQREDLLALCERKGWGVPSEYVDNSVSASNGGRRPAWEELCRDIADGRVTRLAVWDDDRLRRTIRDGEEFIDLAEAHGVELANVGGDIDLSTAQGRMFFRMKGTIASYEVEHKAARQKRANRQRAMKGNPWVGRAFGYTARIDIEDVARRAETAAYNRALSRGASEAEAVEAGRVAADAKRENYNPETDSVDNQVVPREADAIRQACTELLEGASLAGIANKWNAAGLKSTKGRAWTGCTVRQVLTRARNCGLVVHQGQILEGVEAKWPGIVDRDVWEAVCSHLADPGRHTGKKRARAYLLSGIATCWGCGKPVSSGVRIQKSGRRRAVYVCKRRGCMKVVRDIELTDAVVVDALTTLLSRSDAVEELSRRTEVDKAGLVAESDRLRARITATRELWLADKISDEDYALKQERLKSQLEAVSAKLLDANLGRQLDGLVGHQDAAERFGSMDLDRRRAVVKALVQVTLLPRLSSGGPFDPRTVDVQWL
jgi:site-specific DNA recombinase